MINNLPPSFVKWGNGNKVLIFLHYFGGDANCWQWVASMLSPAFTCIAFNLPGCGGALPLKVLTVENYAAFIQAQIDGMGIDQYSVIGHSMGGKIAMQIAVNDISNKVKQLLLIAPSPPNTESIKPADKRKLLQVPDEALGMATVKKLAKISLSVQQLNIAVLAQINTTKAVREWWVNKGSQRPVLNVLAGITCPVIVMASENDPAIAFATIKNGVLPYLQNAHLKTIKNIGHLYPMEAPEWIAEIIEATFNQA